MTAPVGTPMLLLSTQASSLMRLEGYASAVEEADLTGIDLDATNDLKRALVASRSMHKALANQSVRSVWVRPLQLEGSGLQPFRDAAKTCGEARLPLMIVDVPAGVDHIDAVSIQLAAATRLRHAVGSQANIAIAVRAENPEGNRNHLDRLAMIRHQAGEWDYKLALDLTAKADGTWEAEAAMLRVLPRIANIRLTVPRTLLSGGIRWRIASRVIAAATDGGYRGFISLAPELSLWERHSVATLADRSAMFAANVERRALRVRGERTRLLGRRQIR
ncbi:MAG: hypothetical protein ACRDHN_14615 [Thermomicrobiales bacterium]